MEKEVKMLESKSNFYVEKLNYLENNEPITKEEKEDFLQVLKSIINDSEEDVPYESKMMLLQMFVLAVQEHSYGFFTK